MTKRVRIRASAELGTLKPKWDAWCVQRGITSGEALRRFVAQALEEQAEPVDASRLLKARSGPCIRIGVGLTAAELDCVRARAYVNGFSANRWIVALVRAQLSGEPQFGNREMMLLAESNRLLADIRARLGQILPNMHGTRYADEAQWHRAYEVIDEHLRAVRRLIQHNLNRWSS